MENKKIIQLYAEPDGSLSSGALKLYAVPSHLSPFTSHLSPSNVVGCVDLYNYDPLNKRVAVGIMVANEYRRQGHALAMLHELKQMATDNWQLHCIYADIASSNTASLALFRKAGYSQCGHFKEWLEYDSHFIDNIRMQLIL